MLGPKLYRYTLFPVAGLSLFLASCFGAANQPSDITTSSANLHAIAQCSANAANNPCTAWFQYWLDGSTSALKTMAITANVVNDSFDFTQSITGLTPGKLYHYVFCGYGDTNIAPPGLCSGPFPSPGVFGVTTKPDAMPDAGDHSATTNFRTATDTNVATADMGRILSNADTTENPITRDAGYSIPYSRAQSAMSLWLFGDTIQRNGPAFLAGTTAATGTFTAGQVPTSLAEIPTPPAPPSTSLTSPQPFLPVPNNLQTPGPSSVACGSNGSSYPAAWPSGGAQEPNSSTILIVYTEICVDSSGTWPIERLTFTEYDAERNLITSKVSPFISPTGNTSIPSTENLGSPIFGGDGYLYLYAYDNKAAAIYIARVSENPNNWSDPGNYQWWSQPDGQNGQWSNDESSATSIISGINPLSVSAGNYSKNTHHKYVMLTQTGFYTASFNIYESTSPSGPWTKIASSQVPDSCTTTNNMSFGCYAIIGHAELSTEQKLVYSWYSPGDRDSFGHVRIGSIDWSQTITPKSITESQPFSISK